MHTKDTLRVGQTYVIERGTLVFSAISEMQKEITEDTHVLLYSVSDTKWPVYARGTIGTELVLVQQRHLKDLPVTESETAEFKVGDTVHLKAGASYNRPGEYSGKRLYPDDDLVVTRVTTHKLFVRKGELGSFWIDKDRFATAADEQSREETGPAEGDIAVTDPRIAWIWKKAARLADDLDFCEEYDNIATKLGVPPRARARSVLVRFPDVDNTASEPAWLTVQAVSDAEAIEKAKALLRNEGNTYTVEVD